MRAAVAVALGYIAVAPALADRLRALALPPALTPAFTLKQVAEMRAAVPLYARTALLPA